MIKSFTVFLFRNGRSKFELRKFKRNIDLEFWSVSNEFLYLRTTRRQDVFACNLNVRRVIDRSLSITTVNDENVWCPSVQSAWNPDEIWWRDDIEVLDKSEMRSEDDGVGLVQRSCHTADFKGQQGLKKCLV